MKSLSPKLAGSGGLAVRSGSPWRFAAWCALFVFSFCLLTFAQEATIVGTVTDQTGAAVPNVSVTLTNADTGQSRTIKTNQSGEYVAPDLHIGHYTAEAAGQGFATAKQTGIVLAVGDRRRVDFQMKVGGTEQSVTVEANPVAVQADSGEVSGVITGQQVTQLATNGRSVFTLEALQPGASSIQQDFQVPTSAGGDFNVSFNGGRVSHNLWLIDGGEAADRGGGGGSIVMPSLDAIAEFRTMTSNYGAEYGLSSAGTMSMAVKSGTRELHASAWYFGRNDALDARGYFNPKYNLDGTQNKVQELRFHVWGFNVGGPVSFHPSKSNPKTFFFYNMEWRRYITGATLNQKVPLPSTYGGDFSSPLVSALGLTVPHAPYACQVSAAIQVQFAAAGQPLSGCTGGAPDSTLQVAFNGNMIPTPLLDANAQALLGAGVFPKPGAGSDLLQAGNNSPTTGKEEIVRIDHHFNDKFSVFGHFIADQSLQTFGTTMWSGDNVPSVYNTFGNPSYSYVIHATHTISPSLLNEIAYNYNGNRIHILPLGVYKAPSGFTEGNNRIFGGTNALNRIPSISFSGDMNTNYTANWVPWNNTADDYQIRDDLSWVKGSHQIKIGASWSIYKKVQDYFASTQGGFNFDGTYTGSPFADFLLGYAQGYNEAAVKNAGYWNAISPAVYVQDNWRTTKRLTLNLGLRWDGIPHTYEAKNHMSNFYPNLYNPALAAVFATNPDGTINYNQIAANSPGLGPSPVPNLAGYQFYMNGIGFEDKNGVPKGLAKDTWNAFGPRIGFAYDVTGQGKTILRGGFGTMYERIQGNDMYNAATNVPWDYTLNTNNVLFSDPHTNVTGGTITVPIVVSGVTGLAAKYKVPTSYQYSLGVQQALTPNTVFSISYVGNQGRYQSYFQEINLPPSSQLASLQQTGFGTQVGADGKPIPYNGLVAYPGYGGIRLAFTGENTRYNSLQMEVHGRPTHDLNLQAAYTFSRSIDPSTGNGNGWDLDNVSNPYVGWKYDMGPSFFDRTHVAFVNFVYDIPFLRNSSSRLLKATIGGWQLSGIVSMMTGAPLNVSLSGSNIAGIVKNSAGNRPNISGGISYPDSHAILNKKLNTVQWFTANLSAPAAGNWGNLGHNAVRGPGRDNWNLSLFKSFEFTERARLEFRVETFNTWNHTQFGGPGQGGGIDTNYNPPPNKPNASFGMVTSAFDPRVFQLGAKMIF